MPIVNLKNNISFHCEENETILDAAKKNSIAIEHSCANGKCGVCISPISSGSTKAIKAEKFDFDQLNKKILTCCHAPITDIYLNISDLGEIGALKTQTYPCRIDSIKIVSNDVLELVLRLPPSSNFKFVSGQYLNLIFNEIKRSYSIASSSIEDFKLKLYVQKVKNGLMSNYLFNDAKYNDLLRLEGPIGTFSYREDDSKNIVFIANGTGIAPVVSILESILPNAAINKNIHVFWGLRYEKDSYIDFTYGFKGINFHPVFSREKVDNSYFGYVQDAVLNNNIDISTSTIFACGSENMIKSANEKFLKKGLDPSKFFSDAFVSSN